MENKDCGWTSANLLMKNYHDTEWGVPLHDDRKLFEFLLLDAFQAGLSWSTILNKRENFRKAFDNFDAEIISKYGKRKIESLQKNEGIIRNKLKINAAVTNAKQFLKIQKEFGSFDKYIWQFTGGKPIVNKFNSLSEIPAKSKESDAMSKDLTSRGFKFAGSVICYAFMQASGMINDHIITCRRHKLVSKIK